MYKHTHTQDKSRFSHDRNNLVCVCGDGTKDKKYKKNISLIHSFEEKKKN